MSTINLTVSSSTTEWKGIQGFKFKTKFSQSVLSQREKKKQVSRKENERKKYFLKFTSSIHIKA